MTIYDIATAAGVSASTVSRVINHKSGIRKETREKIEKLIEEYNYSPNVAARGLVMQSSKMIGILLVDIRVVHHIDNAFAIEQELAKRGYCSIIMSTGADEANIGSCIRPARAAARGGHCAHRLDVHGKEHLSHDQNLSAEHSGRHHQRLH